MVKFAYVTPDGLVTNISVATADWEEPGWVAYSDANPAYVGGDYVDGMFYPPQPYPSWLRDPAIGNWLPPVAMPTDGGFWNWDEATQSWIAA